MHIVLITGISGSGKSSLVSQALLDLIGAHLGQAGPTSVRTAGYLPATASMQFDSADAAYVAALYGDSSVSL